MYYIMPHVCLAHMKCPAPVQKCAAASQGKHCNEFVSEAANVQVAAHASTN